MAKALCGIVAVPGCPGGERRGRNYCGKTSGQKPESRRVISGGRRAVLWKVEVFGQSETLQKWAMRQDVSWFRAMK